MDNKSFLQVPGSADDRLGLGCSRYSMNNSTSCGHWRCDDISNDKYTAAIELSNKCREFYKSRLEAANNMKSKWRDTALLYPNSSTTDIETSSSISSTTVNDNDRCSQSKGQRTSIDRAMGRLRAEMMSLMDQDLFLMKQLLTLNETIEDLKWQRQYYSCNTSCVSLSASKNLDSNWSVSDTEMYDSEDDFKAAKCGSYSSVQRGHMTGPTWQNTRKARKASRDLDHLSTDSATIRVGSGDLQATTTVMTAKQERSSAGTNCKGGFTYPDCADISGKHGARFTTDSHVISTGVIHHEREQNSFDSGIHDPASGDELMWTV